MKQEEITKALFEIEAVKFGSFKLKSGILSPIYIDLRLLISYPKLLQEIAQAMWQKMHGSHFDLVCGVPYTALPIATCLSVAHQVPMVMRRKELKNYGTKKMIEGAFQKGQICLVIEDLITTGSSVLETVEPLRQEGLIVNDVIVLIDREQGGRQALEQQGLRVHSLLRLKELLSTLLASKSISLDIHDEVIAFLEGEVIHAS